MAIVVTMPVIFVTFAVTLIVRDAHRDLAGRGVA